MMYTPWWHILILAQAMNLTYLSSGSPASFIAFAYVVACPLRIFSLNYSAHPYLMVNVLTITRMTSDICDQKCKYFSSRSLQRKKKEK